jgi:hypothetical protein
MWGSSLCPAFEQISTLDQCVHLAVHNAALKHPEATVRVDIVDALRPKDLHDVFDT